MTSRLDRLTIVMRWAVLAWIVFCAIQVFRWWWFESPALVAGWFGMGAVWGCLLCLIRTSRADCNEWGTRIALFAPTLLFLCQFFHLVWLDQEFEIGQVWCWPHWNLVFDFALLTWGWELRSRRARSMLILLMMAGVVGIFLKLETGAVYSGSVVGVLFAASVCILQKGGAQARPHGMTLSVLLLAVSDAAILAVFDNDGPFGWQLPLLTRLVIQSIVAWRLTSPRREGTATEPNLSSKSFPLYTIRAIRFVGWSGMILWTWVAWWLYPRFVATCSSLHSVGVHTFSASEDAPQFLAGHDFLSEVWLASRQVHVSLEVRPDGDKIPEYLFAIQEVEEVVVVGTATPELRNTLRRFPNLKTIREEFGSRFILIRDETFDEYQKTEDAPMESE